MKKIYLALLILLAVHLFILSQLQFTAWPEMVSFPYLINHGFVTYRDMVHAYPPLLVSTLSVFYKIFGYKLIVLKLFGWVSILAGDLIVFLILKELIKQSLSLRDKKDNFILTGTLIYVILQSVLEGNMVWPDLFIVPFLLLTFLFLVERKYLFAGIAIGLAFLVKQTAFLYIVCSLPAIAYGNKRWRAGMLYFLTGGLLIGVPFLFNLIQQKSFTDFINWTIIYPSKYWTKFPGYVQLSPTLKENLILLVLFLPLAFLIFRASKKIFSEKQFLLLFGFLICGIAGVYPRFSFFHLQSGIAFLVILITYLLSKTNIKYYYLLIIPIFILVINFRSLQFGEARFWGRSDLVLAEIIKTDSQVGQPIYLLGLNSNLYAFADRLPNKPWLDNFGWYLEIPGVQEGVIRSFEENKPSVIFWATPDTGNWYDIGVYQPQKITDWIKKNYVIKKEISASCHCVTVKGVWEWVKR